MIDGRKKKFLLYVFSALAFLLVLFILAGFLSSVLYEEKQKVQPVTSLTQERVTFYYNNQKVALDSHVLTSKSIVYVDANALFSQAGIHAANEEKTLQFTFQGITFSHQLGNHHFTVNDKRYSFLYQPQTKDGKLYYSVEDISRLLGLKVKWETMDEETDIYFTRSYSAMLSLLLSSSDEIDETSQFLAFEWLYDGYIHGKTAAYTGYDPARNADGSLAKLTLPSSVPSEMSLAGDDSSAESEMLRSMLIGRYQIEEGQVVSGTRLLGRYLHITDHKKMDWDMDYPEMGTYVKSIYLS